jgi:hypothetical protein
VDAPAVARRRVARWAALGLLLAAGTGAAVVYVRPTGRPAEQAATARARHDTIGHDTIGAAETTPPPPVVAMADRPSVPATPGSAAGSTPPAEPASRRTEPARGTQRTVALTAPLTVGSEPHGTLYVDGVEVGDTPVANFRLTVGATHEIRVEREGYRTKRERFTVADPNPIRRRFILEPREP